jgi:hypothetical protein
MPLRRRRRTTRLRDGARCLIAALAVALPATLTFAPPADAACPNSQSPGSRTYLPECRAYELVSPAYKEGFSPAGGRLYPVMANRCFSKLLEALQDLKALGCLAPLIG